MIELPEVIYLLLTGLPVAVTLRRKTRPNAIPHEGYVGICVVVVVLDGVVKVLELEITVLVVVVFALLLVVCVVVHIEAGSMVAEVVDELVRNDSALDGAVLDDIVSDTAVLDAGIVLEVVLDEGVAVIVFESRTVAVVCVESEVELQPSSKSLMVRVTVLVNWTAVIEVIVEERSLVVSTFTILLVLESVNTEPEYSTTVAVTMSVMGNVAVSVMAVVEGAGQSLGASLHPKSPS